MTLDTAPEGKEAMSASKPSVTSNSDRNLSDRRQFLRLGAQATVLSIAGTFLNGCACVTGSGAQGGTVAGNTRWDVSFSVSLGKATVKNQQKDDCTDGNGKDITPKYVICHIKGKFDKTFKLDPSDTITWNDKWTNATVEILEANADISANFDAKMVVLRPEKDKPQDIADDIKKIFDDAVGYHSGDTNSINKGDAPFQAKMRSAAGNGGFFGIGRKCCAGGSNDSDSVKTTEPDKTC